MKKASIFAGLVLMISAASTFSEIIHFYGEVKAVNTGYYRNTGNTATEIYCAVQVGADELGLGGNVLNNLNQPILLVRAENKLAKEIYTLLISAQLNGQKVHLRTNTRCIQLGTNFFTEVLEASVGDKWIGWEGWK